MINIAYAASENLDSFIMNVNKLIINPIIVFLFALALVYFLFGVFQFIANAENEEMKTTGKAHMLWGIIGITIMMAVFTIMNIILSTFNITDVQVDKNTGGSSIKLQEYNPPYPPQ
ncbi:hypothetical protein K2P96_00515 [Patescibacteria group bacterium]|nr:hypothetical protein [Patescibacteria group bacterium]